MARRAQMGRREEKAVVGRYLRAEFGVRLRDIAARARLALLEDVEDVSCNLCGKKDAETIAERDKYGLPVVTVMCRGCGLLYLNPRPTPAAYQRFYIEGGRPGSAYHSQFDFTTIEWALRSYTGDDSFRMTTEEKRRLRAMLRDAGLRRDLTPAGFDPFRRLRRARDAADPYADVLYETVAPYVPRGGAVFEVGAHRGRLLVPWRDRHGCTVSGVEPTLSEVRHAQRLRGIELIAGFSDNPAIPEEAFDLVFNARTINHQFDPLGDLRHSWRWLKPDGLMFVDIADAVAKAARRGLEANTVEIDHPYMFSVRTLPAMVAAAGFEIIEVTNPEHPETGARERVQVLARKSDQPSSWTSQYATERAAVATVKAGEPRRPVDPGSTPPPLRRRGG